MNIAALRAVAKYHRDQAAKLEHTASECDRVQHAEAVRVLNNQITFHSESARGLTEIADAFSTINDLAKP